MPYGRKLIPISSRHLLLKNIHLCHVSDQSLKLFVIFLKVTFLTTKNSPHPPVALRPLRRACPDRRLSQRQLQPPTGPGLYTQEAGCGPSRLSPLVPVRLKGGSFEMTCAGCLVGVGLVPPAKGRGGGGREGGEMVSN